MLIFLFGADTFRSSEKLTELKNKYFKKNSSGISLSVLDYEDASPVKPLSEILATQGLFSQKQLIILKNLLTKGSTEEQKELLAFLKKDKNLATDEENVVVFYESDAPKKNGALFKFLSANTKKQEFLPLEGFALSNWIKEFAKKMDPASEFAPSAINQLIAATGNDLHELANEITKLVNFKSGSKIENADIALLVKSKVDSTMFETIEALASGNKSRALQLLHNQIAKGEDIYYILSMYTYQIRTLLKIGDFYWQDPSVATGRSRQMTAPQIAQASGLHPYVVQKSLAQLKNLSETKAKQMLRDLAQIDQDAKTGKVDPLLALDSLIVSL